MLFSGLLQGDGDVLQEATVLLVVGSYTITPLFESLHQMLNSAFTLMTFLMSCQT